MARSHRMWLLGFSGALVALLAGCGSQLDLKFQPKAGELRQVNVTNDLSTAMDVMGRTMNMPAKTSATYTLAVENVDAAGVAAIKATYDSVDLGNMMGPLGAGMGDLNLTGRSFTMKVASTGEVQEVQGMGPIVEEASKKVQENLASSMGGANMPPQLKAQMGQMTAGMGRMMQQMLGDAAVKEQMEDILNVFPDGPVSAGATWTRGVVRSYGQFPMVSSESWKLMARKDGVATLAVKSAITPNASAPGLDFGMGTMKMEPTGEVEGTVEVDEATGWVIKSTRTINIESKMQMNLSGAMAGGTTMPGGQAMTMKVTGTVTVETSPK